MVHTSTAFDQEQCQLKRNFPERILYHGVCRILMEMADAFFSSSWRILELHGCSGISLATTLRYRKGPVRCVPRHADVNLMCGSVHAVRQHDG